MAVNSGNTSQLPLCDPSWSLTLRLYRKYDSYSGTQPYGAFIQPLAEQIVQNMARTFDVLRPIILLYAELNEDVYQFGL